MTNKNFGASLTAEEILLLGLKCAAYTEARMNRVKGDPCQSETNFQRFRDHYGAGHIVVSKLWQDLQLSHLLPLPKNHHAEDRLSIVTLLESLHFLKRYKTEKEREALFDLSPKTLRKACWYHLERIQALKATKITFPDDFGDDIWIMSVDGVHCLANEPKHPVFSQDPHHFSHKKNHAGFGYELGISLFESKLIWMNGPFAAGPNDKANFVKEGLRQKLSSIGKKAVGDKGYTGYPDVCSTFNAFDSDAVKEFKSRAQMRHEKFNGMCKEFRALDERFRHGKQRFKVCFEAVCVVCQYRMENGEPLYDLLPGINMNK